MQFHAIALFAVLAGLASAKTLTVVVGSPTLNKSLAFTPSEITAAAGDIVQFQFSELNHTVTQSTFDTPCEPINPAGIHSGFVPSTAGAAMVQTFDVTVNSTDPLYIYCAQGPHCMLGMVMTINAAADKTFASYKAAAAKATKNVPASAVGGGTLGMIPSAQAVPPPV